MGRYRNRSLGWVFVSRMIGIICFLIVVVLAKILTTFISPQSVYYNAIEGILFAFLDDSLAPFHRVADPRSAHPQSLR